MIAHFLPMSHDLLMEFIQDFQSFCLLKDQMKDQLDSRFCHSFSGIQEALTLLNQIKMMIDQNQLQEFGLEDLKKQIEDHECKKQELASIQNYTDRLESRFHCPVPKNLKELAILDFVLKKLSHLSPKWIELRNKKFIFASLKQIQDWWEEAQDLQKHAFQVELIFEKNNTCSYQDLNKIALELNSNGAFRSLSSSYQKAVQKYRSLLKEDLSKQKQTASQMSENVSLWSDFLYKKEKFETEEKKKILEDYYLGVDTDFSFVLEAIRWRQEWESDLLEKDSFYGKSLLQWIFDLTPLDFEKVVSQEDFPKIQKVEEEDSFEMIEKKINSNLTEWNKLFVCLKNLNYTKKISLSRISELESMLEKIFSLSKKLDRDGDFKQWMFFSDQGGVDLKMIEQGLFFIQHVQSSVLPDFLKKFFLSGSILQKLIENQSLLISIKSSFQTFQDSLEKLQASHGKMKEIMKWKPSVFLETSQKALKQAELLPDWVAYLRSYQETRQKGFSSFLDIYEQSFSQWPLQTVYELIASSSLLKLGLQLQEKSKA
jgi:hypothetical protein